MRITNINFKKICAIVTASSFLLSVLSNISYASVSINPIQSQKNIFDIDSTEQLNNLFSDKYGKIISFNNNSSDIVVLNIQDLHCDYSIQKNISSIIDEISNKYNVEKVYVEGGIGEIDISMLSNINPKYKETIIESLLKEGKLTGTEYYSITKNKGDLLKGLEDKDSYLKNIVRLSNIIKSKKETSVAITKIEKEIDFLEEKYLNSRNKQFSKLLEEKYKGNITQEEFLKGLLSYAKENNINLSGYKNLHSYLSVYSKNFINKNNLKKELIKITKEIKESVSYTQYQQFIKNTSNLTDIKNLKRCVNNYCAVQNIDLEKKYPNLSKFFEIKEERQKINPIAIVKEEIKLIDTIRTMLSDSESEIEISYICDFKELYKGYLTASLTYSQWEYVKLGINKFKDLYAKYSIDNDVAKLDKYSKELNLFYDTNTYRNEVFAKNMELEKVNQITEQNGISEVLLNAKKIKILVAGGYHTDGINEILNEKNITNITITPSITNSTQKSRINYEYLAQKQAMSIRQMIALGLISNATQKEQIIAIVNSLMSNNNLDGININILVEQLNQIFEQNIKVSLTQDKQQLEFSFADRSKQVINIDEVADVLWSSSLNNAMCTLFPKSDGKFGMDIKIKNIKQVIDLAVKSGMDEVVIAFDDIVLENGLKGQNITAENLQQWKEQLIYEIDSQYETIIEYAKKMNINLSLHTMTFARNDIKTDTSYLPLPNILVWKEMYKSQIDIANKLGIKSLVVHAIDDYTAVDDWVDLIEYAAQNKICLNFENDLKYLSQRKNVYDNSLIEGFISVNDFIKFLDAIRSKLSVENTKFLGVCIDTSRVFSSLSSNQKISKEERLKNISFDALISYIQKVIDSGYKINIVHLSQFDKTISRNIDGKEVFYNKKNISSKGVITSSDLLELLNLLRKHNPDIVVLQETNEITPLKQKRKVFVDINEDIANIIEEQNKTDLISSPLVKVDGEKLKEIIDLVLKTTFNCGQEIFAPQIYQISKEICMFTIENKWYLGNGAIWDIANSKYSGQDLDGIKPIIYEYMPDFMQKSLLEKQKRDDGKKTTINKQVKKITKSVISIVLVLSMMLSLVACSNANKELQPYQIQEIQITEELQTFNEEIINYADSFYVGNGEYKSFLYEKMPEFYQNNTAYKYVVKNIENLYDQALLAISYLQMGEIEKAEKILGAINAKESLNKSNLEQTQNTGEIVWVGIAAVQYKLLTGSDKYDSLIAKVDKYLDIVHKHDGSYFGEVVYSWVSTEHMLDIVAYFNLKTLYDDSEELKKKLQLAADYLYTELYNESKGTFRRGFEDEHYVLDTNSWGIQVLLALQEINPEIYKNSQASKIDIEKLVEYIENNFKTSISEGERQFDNLYKWSAEESSPVSFEWSMEVAVAYNMLADYYEKKGERFLAQRYRDNAEAILQDVQNYSKLLGIEKGYIAYSNKNEVRNYFGSTEGGWLVYVVPAVCTTVGQRVQIEYGSFFKPLTRVKEFDYTVEEKNYENVGFIKQEGDNWKTYSTIESFDLREAKSVTIKMSLVKRVPNAKVKIQFLPVSPKAMQNLEGTEFGLYNKVYSFDSDGNLTIKINLEDFKQETFGITSNQTLKQLLMDLEYIRIIVIAGETCFGDELNSTKLNIDIESIDIDYNDSSKVMYKQLSSTINDKEIKAQTLETEVETEMESVETTKINYTVPSTQEDKTLHPSILKTTMDKINNLIVEGISINKEIIKLILREETIYSYFAPERFIREHSANNKGAKVLTTLTDISKIFAVGLSVAFCMIPVVDLTIKVLVVPMILIILPIISNMTIHAIIDFRYLKSIGIEEAVAIYGKENVSLTSQGLDIKNKDSRISIYVINDKPKNVKEFNMKSVPIKIKAENGKLVKCWIGNYKGVPIIFADGAKYETIVKEFSKTKQFESVYGKKTAMKANIEVIEVDMNNPKAGVNYSEDGNIIVGANVVKSGENIDLEKEVSLLNNKKIEAVTINQNIAIYIDEDIETIGTSLDFESMIDLYVNNEKLVVETKILFSNKYIDRVLDILEKETGDKDLAKEKLKEIIQKLKKKNKEIVVIFEEEKENYTEYQKYGISSYIRNNEYVDGLMNTKTAIKYVTNLSQILGFDGSLSVIKVSLFKKEIEKASGIFTLLTSSINIKEYMKNRTINFVKQVAINFDYNQIPNIEIKDIVKMLSSENKFEELSKYIEEKDSIYMYYLSLSSEEEKKAFVDTIIERILVVNYLREYDKELDKCYGLENKKLEDVLSKALVAKYNKDGNLDINSEFVMNENLTTLEFEIEFNKIISDRINSGFKDISTSIEINDVQSIDDIIKLIPLYAERKVELRTADVKVADLQSIKGILSAA